MQINVNVYIYINHWNAQSIDALRSTKGKSFNNRITAEMQKRYSSYCSTY